MTWRTERWGSDGRTVVIDVNSRDYVEVDYDLLAEMLRELGFSFEGRTE